jgi:hypothetical protein
MYATCFIKLNVMTLFFKKKTYKRIFTVARLHVAQPTYGTYHITCISKSELHLTAEYNNQCVAEHIS